MNRLPYELKAQIVNQLGYDVSVEAREALLDLSLVSRVFSELAFQYIWKNVNFCELSTPSLEQFDPEISGRHGRHVRSAFVGDNGPLHNASDSSERKEVHYRILAGLSHLESLVSLGPALLPKLASPPFTALLPNSFGPSLRKLELLGNPDSLLRAVEVASFVRRFPNLEELECFWVGPCTTGEFLPAVQSLGCLKSLSLHATDAVDVKIASSTEWVYPLRKINSGGQRGRGIPVRRYRGWRGRRRSNTIEFGTCEES